MDSSKTASIPGASEVARARTLLRQQRFSAALAASESLLVQAVGHRDALTRYRDARGKCVSGLKRSLPCGSGKKFERGCALESAVPGFSSAGPHRDYHRQME